MNMWWGKKMKNVGMLKIRRLDAEESSVVNYDTVKSVILTWNGGARFGAFSWLWGGFGLGALCLLRGWDIPVTSQKVAMARSCLSCNKKPLLFWYWRSLLLGFFFFFSDLKWNSPDLHRTFDHACESVVVAGGKDRWEYGAIIHTSIKVGYERFEWRMPAGWH